MRCCKIRLGTVARIHSSGEATFCEVSEWRNRHDLIRQMSRQELAHMKDDESRRGQIARPGRFQQMKGQQQAANQDVKNESRATDLVLRKALENSELSEVLRPRLGSEDQRGPIFRPCTTPCFDVFSMTHSSSVLQVMLSCGCFAPIAVCQPSAMPCSASCMTNVLPETVARWPFSES